MLLFATDVSHAFDGYGSSAAAAITRMSSNEAKQRLAAHTFAPGSMQPKVESAVQFVEATRRTAIITRIGKLEAQSAADRIGFREPQLQRWPLDGSMTR